MATAAPYRPVSLNKARSAVGVAVRRQHSAAALQDARAELTVAQLVRKIDDVANDGIVLNDERLSYLADYLNARLGDDVTAGA